MRYAPTSCPPSAISTTSGSRNWWACCPLRARRPRGHVVGADSEKLPPFVSASGGGPSAALAKLRPKLQLLRKSASSQHDNCSLGALVWGDPSQLLPMN